MRLEEIPHQANRDIAAYQNKNHAHAHSKRRLNRRGYRECRTHTQNKSEYRVFTPQSREKCVLKDS